jgi:hypothetical protein
VNSDLPIRPFRSPTFGDRTYRALLGDGREWVVYTIPAVSFDRRAGLSLLFESADVMRRLGVYPDNWYELNDVDLYAISLLQRQPSTEEPRDLQQALPVASSAPFDRRWRPHRDGGEWERTTRESIFEAIQRCIAHAMGGAVTAGDEAQERPSAETIRQELHICAQAYARALYALGHTPASAAAVIVAAARRASEPATLEPSTVSALEEWCREARPPETEVL